MAETKAERKARFKQERKARLDTWYDSLTDSEKAEVIEAYNKITMKFTAAAAVWPFERFCRQCAKVAEDEESGRHKTAYAAAEKIGNVLLREKKHTCGDPRCPYCGSKNHVVIEEDAEDD